jgi:alkylhydroperoxidase family enzyme
MMAYIKEPERINIFSRIIIRVIEKYMGAKLEIARLLLWYPKAALSSVLLESLITFNDKEVNKRLLKLIRMQVSITSSCAFCIDMNCSDYKTHNISLQEIESLQGKIELENISTFSEREKAALKYARELTLTAGDIQSETILKLKNEFSERAILIIASTIAQVNYWTKLMHGLGIQPSGFLKDCPVIELKR